jgi:hypothetical protein
MVRLPPLAMPMVLARCSNNESSNAADLLDVLSMRHLGLLHIAEMQANVGCISSHLRILSRGFQYMKVRRLIMFDHSSIAERRQSQAPWHCPSDSVFEVRTRRLGRMMWTMEPIYIAVRFLRPSGHSNRVSDNAYRIALSAHHGP